MTSVSKTCTGELRLDKETMFDAIRRGDGALISSLMDQGYRLGQRNHAGNTELGYSIVCKQTGIAFLLLERGAWEAETDKKGALNLAILIGAEEVALAMMGKATGEEIRANDNNIRRRNAPRMNQAVWRRLPDDLKTVDVWRIIGNGDLATLKLLVEEDGCDIAHLVETKKGWLEKISGKHSSSEVRDYILQKRAVAIDARETVLLNTTITLPCAPCPTRPLRFKPKS